METKTPTKIEVCKVNKVAIANVTKKVIQSDRVALITVLRFLALINEQPIKITSVERLASEINSI